MTLTPCSRQSGCSPSWSCGASWEWSWLMMVSSLRTSSYSGTIQKSAVTRWPADKKSPFTTNGLSITSRRFETLRLVFRIDDCLRHIRRCFSVVLELHRVRGAALPERTQRRRVAEHFRERHFGAHQLAATAGDIFHALHDAAPAGQIAHHVAHEVFRRFHFDGHHRFEQHRLRAAHAFLELHPAGHAERVFFRIDTLVRTERTL